ncbi:MAG: hypothetical protein ABL888_03730 [Pirellulaceae bacterium]
MSTQIAKTSFFCLAMFVFFVANTSDMNGQDIRKLFGKRNTTPAPTATNQGEQELTKSAGPWLIMCTSFVGENAENEAKTMCRVLNQELKLPTYYFRQDFNLNDAYEGMYYSSNPDNTEKGPDGQLVPKRKKTKTLRKSEFNEVAVMVGDFPSVDDARCQKVLETIKYLRLESIDPNSMHRPLQVYREVAKAVTENTKLKSKGHLGSAFVVVNPLLSDEEINPNKIDSTIMTLNDPSNVEYSLLECPGKYSVRVATFSGASGFNLDDIEDSSAKKGFFKNFGKPEGKLAKAAENAVILCNELRRLGIDAYQFHDRLESYVCVGSYDWISREDALGGKEINPEIEKTILLFKGTHEQLPNQNTKSFVAKTLPTLAKKGIGFDVQPVPILVPKAEAKQARAARAPWSDRTR